MIMDDIETAENELDKVLDRIHTEQEETQARVQVAREYMAVANWATNLAKKVLLPVNKPST